MLKVLIVDDEVLVRTNIKMMLKWEQEGLVLCGEASNGLDALVIIERERPDIILSDIRMPMMDGLQLSAVISDKYPLSKLIVLSNYDDFDYVRSTLKNGAVDYILKHRLNENTIFDAISRAKKLLSENGALSNSYKNHADLNIIALKEKFTIRLLTGFYRDEYEIMRQLELLDMKIDINNVLAVIMEIDDYKKLALDGNLKDMSLTEFAIINITEEILKNHGNGVVSHISNERFVILLSFNHHKSEAIINNSINTLLKQISLSLKKYINISVSFGVGTICENIKNILQSCEVAEKAITNKFYAGKSSILKDIKQDNSKNMLSGLSIETEKKIMLNLKMHQEKELIYELEEIFKHIKSEKISQVNSQMIFNDLLGIVNRVCKENSIQLSEVYSNCDAPTRYMSKLETVNEVEEWILSLFKRLLELTKSDAMPNYSEHIRKAIQFVKKHYGENISLSDITDELKISSVYFGKLFKDEVGKAFSEYLTDLRLEKAKALMEGGKLNIKEIIDACGISNYTYFFRIFKKYTGVTPKDFIKEKRGM